LIELIGKEFSGMNDESFKYILNRKEPVEAINEHFRDAVNLIQSVVDYGTNLIPRCFKSSERKLEDIVILAVLLKHIVSMLDGLEVLVSQGCIYAAHLQVRSLFEAFLNLEWILGEDTSKRARQYYVWNLRLRRKWALRFVSSSADHNDFIRKVEKYQESLLARSQEHNDEASQQAEAISNLLSNALYHEINQEFDRLKGNRKYDVPWYKPAGPNSMADMAERVGYGAEYEVFYSQYSQIIHASSQLDNVKFANNSIIFEPIRKLDHLRPILNVGIGFSIRAFKTVLSKYRPQEIENFSRKYTKDWRNAFLSIKGVTYNVNHQTLDF
jgi:hypothetical protein